MYATMKAAYTIGYVSACSMQVYNHWYKFHYSLATVLTIRIEAGFGVIISKASRFESLLKYLASQSVAVSWI